MRSRTVDGVTPVFVLGCPRSGTTVVGAYVGSSPDVADLGEYAGFYLTHHTAPYEYRYTPCHHKASYLGALQRLTRDFPARMALRERAGAYCDSTPWNLLVARELADLLPRALFVLCLRHYSGAIQSLRRSCAQGFRFAGSSDLESARVWSDFYRHAVDLPPDRTIDVSFDGLCAAPGATLDALDDDLRWHGLDAGGFDRRVLARSHAVPPGWVRPTAARLDAAGQVILAGRPSVDPGEWSAARNEMVRPVVADVDRQLRARARYLEPARPTGAMR
jgi:Sulfotransferase family